MSQLRAALNRDSESFCEVRHWRASERDDRKKLDTGKVTRARLLKKISLLQQASQTICISKIYYCVFTAVSQ